jgi:hypothetical protein
MSQKDILALSNMKPAIISSVLVRRHAMAEGESAILIDKVDSRSYKDSTVRDSDWLKCEDAI